MMSARPVPRPGVLAIEAYVPGKSKAAAGVKVHKLSSNETPLGPSPKAIEAVRASTVRWSPIRRHSARCGRPIAGKYGSIRARPVLGGSGTSVLAHPHLGLYRAGRRGVLTQHGFLGLPPASAILAERAAPPSWRPSATSRRTWTRS
jgi:histidinol-phosphate aminotransferase